MSEFKGTKGRWYTSHRQKPNSSMYDTEVYCEKGKTIAVISWYQRGPVKEIYEGREVLVTRTDREANALLISKAPEMLEMLEEVCENLSIQLGRLGCCGEGDGKDHRADEDDYGGNEMLQRAKQLIKEATEL